MLSDIDIVEAVLYHGDGLLGMEIIGAWNRIKKIYVEGQKTPTNTARDEILCDYPTDCGKRSNGRCDLMEPCSKYVPHKTPPVAGTLGKSFLTLTLEAQMTLGEAKILVGTDIAVDGTDTLKEAWEIICAELDEVKKPSHNSQSTPLCACGQPAVKVLCDNCFCDEVFASTKKRA